MGAVVAKDELKVRRKRLRPRSRPTRFVRLHQLECFNELTERLKMGWSITKVVDFIQQERGEYTDISRDSLSDTLAAYRESLAKTDLIQARMPDRVDRWAKEVREAVDEIKELAKLYLLQMDRIQIDVSTEKTIKKLFKTTGNEIYYAMRILQTSAAIKQDFGLIPKPVDGRPLNVNMLNIDFARTYGSESIQNVIQNPASRRKVVSLVERLEKATRERKKLDQKSCEDEMTGLPASGTDTKIEEEK